MSDYTRACDDLGIAFNKSCGDAIEAGLELRECLAIALGIIQARYVCLGNKQGDAAIEACHKVFLDEMRGNYY